MRPGSIAIRLLAVVLAVVGVLALRDATLSTHQAMDPNSRMELVVRASTHRGEAGQTLDEMVEALILACRLEVSADLRGPLRAEGGGRYRAVLQPALDSTNRRQLRGCIEDWTIDQLRVDVVGFVDLAPS